MIFRVLIALMLCFGLAGQSPYDGMDKPRKKSKKNKKDEEPVTQVLPLPKDLPVVITADIDRLTFFASPLSSKGLLTAQTREALRYLTGLSKTATIVKLRVFVAGSGDTRRIQTLVGEVMTEKKLPLPVVITVQVGSLGVEGAQVLFEATAVDKRSLNPEGLAFISGQVGKSLREAVAGLERASVAVGGAATVSMTCFVSSLDDVAGERAGMAFTGVVVQLRREPSPTVAECEGIARLRKAPVGAVELVNPEGSAKSANYSQVALVRASKVAFSGLQLSFGTDAKLAFERLGKTLEGGGVTYGNVFFAHTYALTAAAMEQVRGVRFGYFDKARPPASTLLPFEGLPSLDATFGVEVVAVVP